jgi:gliding motility-associated lipoprotein GldH
MKIKYPNGEISVDTIECFLADKTGKWLGSGIGKYRDNQIMIRQKGLFPMTGNYEFILQHGMRTEDGNISGIYSVGIRISEFKN